MVDIVSVVTSIVGIDATTAAIITATTDVIRSWLGHFGAGTGFSVTSKCNVCLV